MIAKIALFGLLVLALLAWLGRWWPRRARDPRGAEARRCPSCGRFRIGSAPCDCRG
ncbi:MAG TPA: hypothetical protein VFR34_14075 [Paracoccaceae bacterium]|nr:hypothetical protein [Paracoccaceae bacterium]